MRMPIPKPWHPSHGARWALGITLTRPWPWAFFYGEPHEQKDVENRGPTFPEVPAGTLLAIHTAAGWDGEAATLIRGRIPACAAFGKDFMPRGLIVGVVRVAGVERLSKPASRMGWPLSRWRMPLLETGIWLEPERLLLHKPILCAQGWVGAWVLPPAVDAELAEQLRETGWAAP